MTRRILHIIPNLNKGGAERLVLDICNQLMLDGHEVKLITFSNENEYQFLSKGINHVVIPSFVRPSISGKTEINVFMLQKEIEEFKPHIIHSHLFEAEIVMTAINYSNARFFSHFHNNMPQFKTPSFVNLIKKKSLTAYFEKRIVLRSFKMKKTRLICISPDNFEYVRTNLPASVPKSLLLNSIDLERFSASKDKVNSHMIVTIGSLQANKNHRLAIEIIEQLHLLGHYYHLNILGDGPLIHELSELIHQKQLEKFVHLIGNVDFPETYLLEATAYLHTAKTEAFGLTILEAMAAGKPVFCTDGFGNRNLVINDVNGFFFKTNDPKIIANSIIENLKNASKILKISKEAKLFASNFSMKNYTKKLLDIYDA